jgi:hypothetical protein
MTNNQESPKEYRPQFPMNANDARVAAREDEYLDYLECLKIARESQS